MSLYIRSYPYQANSDFIFSPSDMTLVSYQKDEKYTFVIHRKGDTTSYYAEFIKCEVDDFEEEYTDTEHVLQVQIYKPNKEGDEPSWCQNLYIGVLNEILRAYN